MLINIFPPEIMEMKEKGTRKWHEAKLTGNHEKRCIYSNLTLHIQSHNSQFLLLCDHSWLCIPKFNFFKSNSCGTHKVKLLLVVEWLNIIENLHTCRNTKTRCVFVWLGTLYLLKYMSFHSFPIGNDWVDASCLWILIISFQFKISSKHTRMETSVFTIIQG